MLSNAAGMLDWCQDSIGGQSSSSHITTYHLHYVKVPQTFIIQKGPGEHTYIELTKVGDDVDVTAVR